MANQYPVWRYHPEKMPEGIIVRSKEQELALGSGWVDSPAAFGKPEKAPEAKVAEKPEAKEDEKPAANEEQKPAPQPVKEAPKVLRRRGGSKP